MSSINLVMRAHIHIHTKQFVHANRLGKPITHANGSHIHTHAHAYEHIVCVIGSSVKQILLTKYTTSEQQSMFDFNHFDF